MIFLRLCLILAVCCPSAAAADESIRKTAESEGIAEYRLANGLRVLLYPINADPAISVSATYFAGARHEEAGETGLAHLMEHLMFGGTSTYHNIRSHLESLDAGYASITRPDRVSFAVVLPASIEHLAFLLALEAERMMDIRMDTAHFARELAVMRKEFEVEEVNPAGLLERRTVAAAFLRHGYGRPTLVVPDELPIAPLTRIQEFYRRLYRPDNALIVVAGKFEPAAALPLVEKYFGSLRVPDRPPVSPADTEPAQERARSVEIQRLLGKGMAVVLYRGPRGSDADFTAAQAAARILTSQPRGRLYSELVANGPAEMVTSAVLPTSDPGLIRFLAIGKLETSVELRDRMAGIIEKFSDATVSEEELDRYRAQALKDLEESLSDGVRAAWELPEWAGAGDWRGIFAHRDRLKRLTRKDVRRAAKLYFKSAFRTAGVFVPKILDKIPLDYPPETAMVNDAADTVVKRDITSSDKQKQHQTATAQPVSHADSESAPDSYDSPLTQLPATTIIADSPVATPAARVPDVSARSVTRLTLKNGMEAAFVEGDTRSGDISFILTIHAGLDTAPSIQRASLSLRPHLLPRGSKKYSSREIQEMLARRLSTLSFSAGDAPGDAVIRGRMPAAEAPEVLALLAELVKRPAFSEDEFERLKAERISKLEAKRRDPERAAARALLRRMDDSALSFEEEISGVRAASPEDIRLLGRLWPPAAAEITFMGASDPAKLAATLEKRFGRDPVGGYARGAAPEPYRVVGANEEKILVPGMRSAVVAAGWPVAVREDDTDFAALSVLSWVLGTSPESRLVKRFTREPVIGATAAFATAFADPVDRRGYVHAGLICSAKTPGFSQRALEQEIELVRRYGIRPSELAAAKDYFKDLFEKETVMDDGVLESAHRGTLETRRMLHERIQALTPSAIRSAGARHLREERMIKVRVGDFKNK